MTTAGAAPRRNTHLQPPSILENKASITLERKMPRVIISWLTVTSVPRTRSGLHSARYKGTTMLAKPTLRPTTNLLYTIMSHYWHGLFRFTFWSFCFYFCQFALLPFGPFAFTFASLPCCLLILLLLPVCPFCMFWSFWFSFSLLSFAFCLKLTRLYLAAKFYLPAKNSHLFAGSSRSIVKTSMTVPIMKRTLEMRMVGFLPNLSLTSPATRANKREPALVMATQVSAKTSERNYCWDVMVFGLWWCNFTILQADNILFDEQKSSRHDANVVSKQKAPESGEAHQKVEIDWISGHSTKLICCMTWWNFGHRDILLKCIKGDWQNKKKQSFQKL